MSLKQNGIRWKNTYVEILLDSGDIALKIHKSYVNKNNLTTRKTSANQWSTMAESFSMSYEAKIILNIVELKVTTHISASFHVTITKSNYNLILSRDFLRELRIRLGFQNNFTKW